MRGNNISVCLNVFFIFKDSRDHFTLFFLSVKARTAQLAKIKWVISVAFYILQVSALWCHLGSLKSIVDSPPEL